VGLGKPVGYRLAWLRPQFTPPVARRGPARRWASPLACTDGGAGSEQSLSGPAPKLLTSQLKALGEGRSGRTLREVKWDWSGSGVRAAQPEWLQEILAVLGWLKLFPVLAWTIEGLDRRLLVRRNVSWDGRAPRFARVRAARGLLARSWSAADLLFQKLGNRCSKLPRFGPADGRCRAQRCWVVASVEGAGTDLDKRKLKPCACSAQPARTDPPDHSGRVPSNELGSTGAGTRQKWAAQRLPEGGSELFIEKPVGRHGVVDRQKPIPRAPRRSAGEVAALDPAHPSCPGADRATETGWNTGNILPRRRVGPEHDASAGYQPGVRRRSAAAPPTAAERPKNRLLPGWSQRSGLARAGAIDTTPRQARSHEHAGFCCCRRPSPSTSRRVVCTRLSNSRRQCSGSTLFGDSFTARLTHPFVRPAWLSQRRLLPAGRLGGIGLNPDARPWRMIQGQPAVGASLTRVQANAPRSSSQGTNSVQPKARASSRRSRRMADCPDRCGTRC